MRRARRRHSTKAESFERQALVYLSALHAVALRYARDEQDAEDLVQETLLSAFAAWERFEQGTNCKAWLFRILTNNFINDRRRASKERRWITRDGPMIAWLKKRSNRDPESALIEPTLADEVVGALRTLPPEYRDVVVLADLRGLSYRETANALGCPIGTVMSRLHRGRRLLEPALGDYAREQGILKAAA